MRRGFRAAPPDIIRDVYFSRYERPRKVREAPCMAGRLWIREQLMFIDRPLRRERSSGYALDSRRGMTLEEEIVSQRELVRK